MPKDYDEILHLGEAPKPGVVYRFSDELQKQFDERHKKCIEEIIPQLEGLARWRADSNHSSFRFDTKTA